MCHHELHTSQVQGSSFCHSLWAIGLHEPLCSVSSVPYRDQPVRPSREQSLAVPPPARPTMPHIMGCRSHRAGGQEEGEKLLLTSLCSLHKALTVPRCVQGPSAGALQQ